MTMNGRMVLKTHLTKQQKVVIMKSLTEWSIPYIQVMQYI